MKNNKIKLSIDIENLDKFCVKLIKRSRDIAKTHDALVTLIHKPLSRDGFYSILQTVVSSIEENKLDEISK